MRLEFPVIFSNKVTEQITENYWKLQQNGTKHPTFKLLEITEI